MRRLSKFEVRRYQESDKEECVRVFQTNVFSKYFVDDEQREYEEFLENLPGPYFVVEDASGELIACGGYAVNEGTSTADLCWGMVRRNFHGNGIGKFLLMARLERASRDPSVTTIHLNTSQHTVGFYENLGFVATSVKKDGYGAGMDRYDMEKQVKMDNNTKGQQK